MSIKNSLVKNAFAVGVQKGIRVIEQLILVPFFIYAWGQAFYGEWLTLTIIPTILSFTEIGIGSAAANAFVLAYVSGNYQIAFKTIRIGFLILTYTVIFGCIIGGLLLWIFVYTGILKQSVIPQSDAVCALSLIILSSLIDFFLQLYEGYFRASRKAYYSINLLSCYAILKLVLSIIVLLNKGGVIMFAFASLSASILFMTFYALKAKSSLPHKEKYTKRIEKKEIYAMFKNGFGYLLSPVWQAIFFQGTTFVVRLTLGPEAVVLFNTVRTASRSANQAFSILNGSIYPELQFEIGAGRMENARKLFRVSLSLVLFIALAVISFLFLFGPSLYGIWTQNALLFPSSVWNLFLIGIGFNALWWTVSVSFRASNKPYHLAIAGLIAAICSVLLSYFLSNSIGLVGAAIGSLFFEIIMAIYVLPISCRIMGQDVFTLGHDIIADTKNIFGKMIPSKSKMVRK